MAMNKDLSIELNEIRSEIASLEERLHLSDMDHLRLYGYEISNSEMVEKEIAALEQRLGVVLRQIDGNDSRINGLLSLEDTVQIVRSKYGLN